MTEIFSTCFHAFRRKKHFKFPQFLLNRATSINPIGNNISNKNIPIPPLNSPPPISSFPSFPGNPFTLNRVREFLLSGNTKHSSNSHSHPLLTKPYLQNSAPYSILKMPSSAHTVESAPSKEELQEKKILWQKLPPFQLQRSRSAKNFETKTLKVRTKLEKTSNPLEANIKIEREFERERERERKNEREREFERENERGREHEHEREMENSVTAIQWISKCYPDLPRSFLQKSFRKRRVRLEHFEEGKLTFNRISANRILKEGDILCLPMSVNVHERQKHVSKDILAKKEKGKEVENEVEMIENRKRQISEKDKKWVQSFVLYMDSEIIILNKPSGFAVQGGSNVTKNLDSLLYSLCYENAEKPKLVHRLDKDTSGLIMLSRNKLSAQFLSYVIKSKTMNVENKENNNKSIHLPFNKTYFALVFGVPKKKIGIINAPLTKLIIDNGKSDRIIVSKNMSSVKQVAITEYKVVSTSSLGVSLLELSPLTGRKHQLRVHCASVLGTPIIGDFKYGAWAQTKWENQRENKKNEHENAVCSQSGAISNAISEHEKVVCFESEAISNPVLSDSNAISGLENEVSSEPEGVYKAILSESRAFSNPNSGLKNAVWSEPEAVSNTISETEIVVFSSVASFKGEERNGGRDLNDSVNAEMHDNAPLSPSSSSTSSKFNSMRELRLLKKKLKQETHGHDSKQIVKDEIFPLKIAHGRDDNDNVDNDDYVYDGDEEEEKENLQDEQNLDKNLQRIVTCEDDDDDDDDKGSIMDESPMLHLHCKRIIIPDAEYMLNLINNSDSFSFSFDAKFDSFLSSLKEQDIKRLEFDAPLPLHMVKSLKLLKLSL